MKRVLVICLVLALAVPLGCSKKKEPQVKDKGVKQETSKGGVKASLIDPVSKKPVDIIRTPYFYEYKGVEYYFETEENMKAFKKDPEAYLHK